MFYFLHGTDTIKSFEKSQRLVQAMLSKKPDASLFRLGTDGWQDAELQELISGQGLFEQKYIVTLSRVLEDVIVKETVLKFLPDIAGSENIFIWTEGKMDAKTLQKIEKHAEKIECHDAKEKQFEVSITAFPLTDMIGVRDKKKAWLLFEGLLKKLSAEEIHGTVVWLFKTMMLASQSKSATETGLKPFVYSKSKKFAQNFTAEELQDSYFKLVSMSHEAHRGKCHLGIELEKFILGF